MSANRSLLDRYVELYSEDAVQHMRDGTFRGRNAIRERLASDLRAFSNVVYTVTRFLEQGETFADEYTIVGTNTGPLTLPGGTQLPPTGKRVQIKGMEFVQLRDGKIVIDNLYYDSMAIVGQLGLVPQGATV